MRLLLLLLLLAPAALAQSASSFYHEARQAEKQGNDIQAFALALRAATLDPKNPKYSRQADRLRTRAAQSLAALGQLEDALAVDPGNAYVQSEIDAVREEPDEASPEPAPDPAAADPGILERIAQPTRLAPQSGSHSFNLRGDIRSVYEQVFHAYGLDIVFDPDFTPGAAVRFRLDDADFRQTARALMAVTGTFFVPVHERVALVAKEVQQKRTEFDPMMVARLPIPQVISVEEANELGRAVQQALDIRRLTVDPTRRQVIVRDTVGRVRLARALYEELARSRAEIVLDVDLLSASRSAMTNLGLTLPTNFTAAARTAGAIMLGGGQTLFGIQIASSNFEASLSRSETRFLSSFQLRATDGLPASLHIGDRYPIVNALFSPIVITQQIQNLQQSGQLRQPFPSIQFEDLGLVMKVTPRIHDSHEVSLTIEADFRLLTGESVNSLPVISERKFSSAVRLKEGETSVVSGLSLRQLVRSTSGLLGLAQLPVLGKILSRNTWESDENELLLTIRPRLTNLPPAEQVVHRAYYFGTDAHAVAPL